MFFFRNNELVDVKDILGLRICTTACIYMTNTHSSQLVFGIIQKLRDAKLLNITYYNHLIYIRRSESEQCSKILRYEFFNETFG